MKKTEFVIKLADKNIDVKCNFDSTKEFCKDYISSGDPDISIDISKQDLVAEAAQQEDAQASDRYLEQLALYRKIATELLNHNVLLYHSSAIEVDGNAYIFAAKSGTGKSTHAKLWREYLDNATMINDDKPLIKVDKDASYVYGTPWDGKHRLSTNTSAPLRAILILSQGKENKIQQVDKADTLPNMLQQTFMPEDALSTAKILELLDQMLKNVKVYKMECLPNIDAAKLAYETIKN